MSSSQSTRASGRRKHTHPRVAKRNRDKPTTKAQRKFIRELRHELGITPTAVPDTREWAAKEIDALLVAKGRKPKPKPSARAIKNARAVAVSIARDKAAARHKLEVAGEQSELKRQAMNRMARS